MKRFRWIFVFVLGGLFFLQQHARAQTGSEKTIISRADQLFQQREYEQAFSYYMKLKDLHAEVLLYQFRAGVCCIYQGDGEQALTLLKPCYEKDPNIIDINFFLGRAYLLNDMFDDALLQFNLQLAKEPNEAEKVRLQQYVSNCMSGKELINKQANTLIENPGRPLNTPGAEFAPILTRNDSVIIYTYKGPSSTGGKDYTFGKKDSAGVYYEDIFLSMKGRNGWFFPQGLSTTLNSNAHDACTAISNDGQKLYTYRSSNKDGGDIYVSKAFGKDWTIPTKVNGINSIAWEGSVAFTPDGKTMYFASDRAGGFGGKDIYKATQLNDSVWGNVENLGAAINTAMDEDAPSIYPDGTRLIFASRGHNSIGGYDIFVSELASDAKTWQAPNNVGVPINSTADDIYYTVASDATRAAFASNRKGGSGQMDIYFAEPGLPAKANELILLKGQVTLDTKPISAIVTVTYTNKETVQGDYKSNAENGRYAITLPPGEDYRLVFMVSSQDEFTRTYDATQIKNFTSNEINVEFFSDTFKMKHPEKFGIMSKSDSARVADEQKKNNQMIGKDGKKIKMVRDSTGNFSVMDEGYKPEPGYYVVIGSFKNKDYAKRLEAKEVSLARYPKIQRVFNSRNGFMYVTVAHPATREEAEKLIAEIRPEYADVWIQLLE
jgi:hypothetical protein